MSFDHPLNVVILAAGKGTRMKSKTPKVFHKAAGLSLVEWVKNTAEALSPENLHVVLGPEGEEMIDSLTWAQELSWSVQRDRKGTGHAVMQAEAALKGAPGYTLVLYADTPLVTEAALTKLVAETMQDEADVAVTVFDTPEPGGYGRIILDETGRPDAIVEFKDADEAQRAVTLCNGGLMLARTEVLFEMLARTTDDNAAGEFYITDVVALARKAGLKTRAALFELDMLAGVNSRQDLAHIESVLQDRLRKQAMANGVTFTRPDSVTLCHDTQIGADTLVEPNVFFGPGVSIGENCHIKAGCYFEGAQVADQVIIGPYARLREGSDLNTAVKVGNFVEIKNATMRAGSKAPHLTYVGDADVGEKANLGAGTITCNYDGVMKHKTVIGQGTFIGSNSALVAPVTIGDGALVGAGSVVTADVEDDAIVTTRGETKTKAKAATRYRDRLRSIKARKAAVQ